MIDTNLSDEDLIRAYLYSEPSRCFDALYLRYAGKVFDRCFSLTRNAEQAQDFTHDIFILVFNKLSGFEYRSRFSTWLYSISFNYCLTQLRRDQRLKFYPLESVNSHYIMNTAFSPSIVDDPLGLINQALTLLPLQEQRLMKLRYEAGMSIEQITQLYGLKASAVKMRLNRTRKKVLVTCQRLANS
ncbi:RNA polymerase sigma factor [uncultured Fibrella sp.]|uniref:RNA polymerase sigma factor n=1 Tax=uncultured Fibrella sp. TaxID=1284596 RepID=UPI0035CA3FF8